MWWENEGHEYQAAQGKILATRHRHAKRDAIDQGVHAEGDENAQAAHPTRRFGCHLLRVAQVRQGEIRQDQILKHVHEQKTSRNGHRREQAGLFVGQHLLKVVQAFRHHQEQRRSEQCAATERDHQRQLVETPFPVKRDITADHANGENDAR